MSFAELKSWVEAHPYEAAAIGGIAVIALLYLLGYFGGGSSSTDQNLASSFYSAEAAQTAAGSAQQIATIQAATATAIAADQYNAAEAIATTQANAATTINSQNVGAQLGLAGDALLATQANDAANVTMNASNNATSIANTKTVGDAAVLATIFGKTIPTEIASGVKNFGITNPIGGGTINVGKNVGVQPLTPKAAKAAGYTPAQFAKITGLPKMTAKQWARV